MIIYKEDFNRLQVEKFWSQVNKTDYCWNWTKSVGGPGYGQFCTNGITYGAHRVSYALANEHTPEDLMVMHECDNRRCVRPSHLSLGTNKDNMDDRKNKGLGRVVGEKGELHTLAKLTEEKVIWARLEYTRGRTGKEIAEELGISPTTISRALKGVTWSHVPGAISGDLYQTGDRHHHKGGRPKI